MEGVIMKKRIYLSPPHLSGREKNYLIDTLDSNWIAPLGPQVDAFEEEMAAYLGVKGTLALSSGTAAIHLALRLLGVSAGDTVFCSTLTFVATAAPVIYQGATPVFIDSEPSSWNMSVQALQQALADANNQNRLPKAVIVVNLYGQSADLEPIMKLCQQYDVPVIEDAAESLGATYKGKPSGTIGHFGVFSFNGNKIITTSGGGMLVSKNMEALAKARFWATQARDPARHYQHSEVGYNYRLSNLLAGVGRAQLKVLNKRIEARRAVFERYYKALEHTGVNFMPEASFGYCTRWLTALTINTSEHCISVNQILDAFERENIEVRPVWKPLHLQPLFTHCLYYSHGDGTSVSEELFNAGICLPSGSSLTEEEQQSVTSVIKNLI